MKVPSVHRFGGFLFLLLDSTVHALTEHMIQRFFLFAFQLPVCSSSLAHLEFNLGSKSIFMLTLADLSHYRIKEWFGLEGTFNII